MPIIIIWPIEASGNRGLWCGACVDEATVPRLEERGCSPKVVGLALARVELVCDPEPAPAVMLLCRNIVRVLEHPRSELVLPLVPAK